MEALCAPRSSLNLAHPLTIPARHQNGSNHKLRVQACGQGSLDTPGEALRERQSDLRAHLPVEGTIRAQKCTCLSGESIVQGKDRRGRGPPLKARWHDERRIEDR